MITFLLGRYLVWDWGRFLVPSKRVTKGFQRPSGTPLPKDLQHTPPSHGPSYYGHIDITDSSRNDRITDI